VSDFVVRRLDADVVFVPMERDGIRHSDASCQPDASCQRGTATTAAGAGRAR
jgi:hypothetical protein